MQLQFPSYTSISICLYGIHICVPHSICRFIKFSYCFCFSSFFQSVCVLGYCVLPLTVALMMCKIILLAQQTTALFAVRCIIVLAMFGWSTFGKCISHTFLATSKTLLLVYLDISQKTFELLSRVVIIISKQYIIQECIIIRIHSIEKKIFLNLLLRLGLTSIETSCCMLFLHNTGFFVSFAIWWSLI